jgi:hypothetical protein
MVRVSLEPLSPWERGWGEGRAQRTLRASPSITTRLLLQLLRAGARALPGAPGEGREAVDQPAGSPARMPAMFVTVQGCTVHEHPRAHANPERRDARRARTRGGLSLAYLSLATQRKVGRAGRRSDRKLLVFASSICAMERNRGKGVAHGGPGPTLFKPLIATTRRADRKLSLFVSRNSAKKCNRSERGAHGGPGPTLCESRSAPTFGGRRKLSLRPSRKAASP